MHFGRLETGEFFVLKFDNDQAVAVIADSASPGHYILHYLAGDVGLLLFKKFASEFGIREMTDYKNKVPHIPLLMLSFPAFVASSRLQLGTKIS